MVRLTTIIAALTTIALATVYLRREQDCLRYEIQRSLSRQTQLRRKLWDQNVRIGELASPTELRSKVRQGQFALELTDEDQPRVRLAEGHFTSDAEHNRRRPDTAVP